ncbi:unnamed protein product [Closterium sp. NIES-64]|nr:unnamed protein product [Closterium sp. NIES-64]
MQLYEFYASVVLLPSFFLVSPSPFHPTTLNPFSASPNAATDNCLADATFACCCWALIQPSVLTSAPSPRNLAGFRGMLRDKYGLPSRPCVDAALHLFCPCCAFAQEYRELKARGWDPRLGKSQFHFLEDRSAAYAGIGSSLPEHQVDQAAQQYGAQLALERVSSIPVPLLQEGFHGHAFEDFDDGFAAGLWSSHPQQGILMDSMQVDGSQNEAGHESELLAIAALPGSSYTAMMTGEKDIRDADRTHLGAQLPPFDGKSSLAGGGGDDDDPKKTEAEPEAKSVKRLLKSSKWDTRVAAAKALGYIARNTPHPTVQDLQIAASTVSGDEGTLAARNGTASAAPDGEGAAPAAAGTTAAGGGLRFEGFDIGRVLDNGAPLVASAGKEYDIAAVGRGGKEAIAKQKQSLRRRLGLDECERFMDVSDIIRDEDLEAPAQAAAPPATGSSNPAAAAVGKQKQKQEATAGIKRGAQDLMAEMLPSGTSPGVGDGGSSAGSVSPALSNSLSARERNMLKRKAKSMSKDGGKRGGAHGGVGEVDEDEDGGEGERGGRKKMRTKSVVSDGKEDNKITVEQVAAEGDDWEEEEEEEGEWPLQALCEQLLTDMFHPVWEVRHGSILALREVMSAHGNCAAVCRPIVPSKWASANGNEEIEDGNGKMELEVVKEEDDGKTVPEMRELDVGLVKAPMVSSEKEEEGVNKKMEVVDHWGIRKEERVEAEGLEDVKQEVKEREFVSKPLVAVKREIEVGTSLKAEVKEEAKGEEEGMKTRAEEELKVEDEMGVIEGRLEGVKREAKAESKEGSGGWLGLSMGSETPKESNGESASGGKLAATAGVCVKEEAGEGGGKGGEDNRAERSGFDLNELLVCKVEDTEASVTNQEGVINQNSGGRARMGLDLHLSDGMQSEEMGEGVVRNLGNEKSIEGIKVEANTDEAEEKSKREGSEKAVGKGLDLNMEVSEEANEGKHVDGGEVAEEKNGEEKESALVVAQRVRAAEKGATATMESARKAELAIEAARKAQADNELFLEDCAIRLLCIFALDRLEDFVSDQVVAPVREACGQALGVVLKYLPSRAVARTLDVLLQMQNRSEWEVRHGALLGIKYLIAVRQELLPSLLPSLLPACIRALQDSDDDVRAVAAEALLPAAKTVGEGVDESDLRQLMRLLWGILSELDDLSPSTSSSSPHRLVAPLTPPSSLPHQHLQLKGQPAEAWGLRANMHTSVTATVAAAAVRVSLSLPSKLNPIIQPLMAALKREREVLLQQCVASGLASVILRSLDRRPSPNDRLLKNLSTLACSDPSQCPPPCDANKEADDPLDPTLAMPAAAGAGGAASKGAAGVIVKGEGAAGSLEAMIGRRGAELSFRALADSLGPDLFTKLPKLWGLLTEVWKPGESEGGGSTGKCDEGELFKADPLALVNTFQLIRCLSLVLHTSLIPQLLLLLPPVLCCTRHPHAAVRFASAQCLAALVSLLSAEQTVLSAILTHVIPQLTNTLSEPARRGAASVVSSLVNTQGEMLAPYAALLVVPLLARMSDPSPQVRQLVTQSFARLVPLLPLARGLPLPAFLDKEGARKAREDARFLEQLLDNRKADDYQLQVKLSVTLRRYQQEGVNWLAFLRRFHLHGVLCDDMGLGKTLQASSMLASDTIERQAAARAAATGPTSAADRAAPGASGFGVAPTPLLPSLIVCPPTLVAHWVYEIEKYIPRGIFFPLQYAGSVADRQRMRGQLRKHNLVVTSYEVLRSDIDELAAITWRYCVLDEGHLIKGAKTRLSQAVRRIKAEHRLLLTGTPIQNNVLELWALFDFLMPGFLGTEKQFQARYGKPLQAARDPKCTAKQAEAGALAMEALHRQVMPFILRRTKEQVLSDLPPKIITDRYCQLSTLQRLLYADFSKSHASEEVVTAVTAAGGGAEGGGGEQASTHVFQALQYLRKLCSHPLLVLDPSHPRHAAALAAVGASGAAAEAGPRGGSSSGAGSSGGDGVGDVHDIVHAPKLVALRDILLECGIGGGGEGKSGGDVGGEASEGNHRVLVFAQLKSFLDIVEEDLFKKHMPGVSYLRIDGSVEPSRRFDLVKAFNSDPTIDVLLLTTHVGGLGLNLTAADTVVFLEHDWNPMRDLQAMDRAHRLGQRRTVNVHRVIMAGTLEEKVMGLQRFKLSIANAVVNADNASLKSMDTSQLLDLFNAGPPAASAGAKKPADSSSDAAVAAAGGGKGLKAVLTGLEDLWDESQYAEEYNLDNFLKRI